jgi:hypothetical protein
MAMTRTQESRWDFESYLNAALIAAHLGKPWAYWLQRAAEDAWFLGWERHRERILAVQNECLAIQGATSE